jgi:DNA-binding MarR family transcriptional regulator
MLSLSVCKTVLSIYCQRPEGLPMNESQKGLLFSEIILEVFKLGGILISKGDLMGMEYGVTSARWKILGAIFLAGEPQTVPQIARRMGLTRQAVQRLVDVMHKDDLLLFHKNPDHKRAKLIDLTNLGKEIFIKLDEKQSKQAITHSSDIPQAELATALSVLKRMSDAIDR